MHIYYCQGSLKSHISVTGTFQDADLTSQKKKKKKKKKKNILSGLFGILTSSANISIF